MNNAHQQRLELKIKELETKLELELTQRARMDNQILRLKETCEKLRHEGEQVIIVLPWKCRYFAGTCLSKLRNYSIICKPYFLTILQVRLKESSSQDESRKLQRQLRDLKETYATLQVGSLSQFLFFFRQRIFFHWNFASKVVIRYRIAHPFGLVCDYTFIFGAVLHWIDRNKG